MSRRKEKICAAGVFLGVFLLYMVMAALFPEHAAAEEAVVHESEKEAETTGVPSGYPDELSAMPCCNVSNTLNVLNQENPTINQDLTKEAASEPETEEETGTGETGEGYQGVAEGTGTTVSDPSTQGTDASEASAETEAVEKEAGFRIYRIAGELPDPEMQRAIYDALLAAEIPYWYEGALAQCFQESHFQRFAVNQQNGLDSGLFQYRSTYWDWAQGDIFDAGAQIRKYAAEMAARFNAGLSVDEAISRHKTSDYCTEIDWEYVRQVRQWLGQMEVVEWQ